MSNTNDKILLILTQVSTYEHPISIKALSDDLDIPLSSLYRYISLLKEWNLIDEVISTKEIFIGSTALLLSKSHLKTKGDNNAVEEAVQRLSQRVGETAIFAVPAGYYALCVASQESQEALRISFSVGQTQPLIKGATSKVLLAHLSKERRHKIAEFYGVDMSSDAWNSLIFNVQTEGYCTSTSEYNNGVVGVSVPILRKGSLLGALSILAPSERATNGIEHYLQAILSEASNLCGSR